MTTTKLTEADLDAHEADRLPLPAKYKALQDDAARRQFATLQPGQSVKLLWPPHNSCSGSCNQGRACDCSPFGEQPELPREPMTCNDALLTAGMGAAAWLVVYVLSIPAIELWRWVAGLI